jgi:hypothetical protein
VTLAVPLRSWCGLEDFITLRHLDNMGKMLLTTGWIVAFGYLSEFFLAWYGGNPYDTYMAANRAGGPYRILFWSMLACNVGLLQALWWPRLRVSPLGLFFVSLGINAGMWLERFVIVITSLHRDFLPSAWGMYAPTAWDWMTLGGSLGLFLALFLLFARLLPVASMAELKKLAAAGEG